MAAVLGPAVCHKLFKLPKRLFDDVALARIRDDLTMKPVVPKYLEKMQKTSGFYSFAETQDDIYVPKFYVTQNISRQQLGPRVEYTCSEGVPLRSGLEFKGTLRTDVPQRDAFNKILEHYDATEPLAPRGAIVQLPCGFGKTVLAIAIAVALKRRTLILVHKEFLMDQWIERINQFVPGCKIGRVQQARCDLADADLDFAVGMIQSLAKRDYPAQQLDTVGLVIVDECHHMAANFFATALPKFAPKFTLGLTATPNRSDGLERLLYYSMGPIVFTAQRDDCLARVTALQIVYTTGKQEVVTNRSGDIIRPTMITKLTEDPGRNQVLIDTLKLVPAGRKTIVLSDRIEHLQHLDAKLADFFKANNLVSGYYIGNSKKAVLEETASNADVIFASFPMAAEGLDIPRLDTLLIASPKHNVEQSIGRILRKHPDKKPPLILDVVDPFSAFNASSWKRFNYYKTNGYRTIRVEWPSEETVGISLTEAIAPLIQGSPQ